MKQVENNKLCKYCLGCGKQEIPEFDGVNTCKGFYPAYKDWQERYYKSLKGDKRK